ncbi:LOW QUALITY PROTEIN: serine-rich adhesin for platelets-like [Thrips palmi]|uniref:LOW QUALITY PROTEIN: serine-rich adhesin for platelets-like n=1 Tax=Thrips palmi TaxID=161013 RepID=A0A6P8ZHY7_THRPL|nr:LOW QUALITY PROTEIN: serine-rich adhesin for platelets-like [Thrips palmi]
METLLPSEVARLVLGYLEDEKCTDAAKCFLDSSLHLNEIRILAQKGKKYPTKVNGFSLAEVLEEYCLIYTIVQESLSSMTEQPNGGSLIDNLRYVVRHCQPVQVHINLHPQGQNSSTNKSEVFDSSTGSNRPRSRKTTVTQGQVAENVDQTSTSQPALNSTVKDSSTAERLVAISTSDTHLTAQPPLHEPQLVTSGNPVCTQVNQDANIDTEFSSPSLSNFPSCQNAGLSSEPVQNALPESSSTFQIVNMDTQEQNSLITTTQQSDSSLVLRSVQQVPSAAINSNNEVVMHTGAEYLRLESVKTQNNCSKPEEPNCSFVTKCYGSSIVFLDNNALSEPCTSKTLPPSNSIQENYDYAPILTPTKTPYDRRILAEAAEKFKEKLLNNDEIVSKLVENINKVFTPAKESDNSLAVPSESFAEFSKEPYLDDFLHEFLQSTDDHDLTISSEGEQVRVLNSSPGSKKKKSVAKNNNGGVSKLKQLCENAVSNISGESSTPSKQSLVKLINSANFTVPERATPMKGASEAEVMTPMTKLIKSITSPSGELYLEPSQFSNLIDVPCKDQSLPALQAPNQFSHTYPIALNNAIEVPRPHGPPLHVPVVNCSPTEVVEYTNQEGVSTISTGTIEVVRSTFVPIAPKLEPGDVLLQVPFETFQLEQPKKRQQRAKQCITRGGRQSSGQTRAAKLKAAAKEIAASKDAPAAKDADVAKDAAAMTDTAELVTIYAADGIECNTVSYSSSSDLPILMSDNSDEATGVQPLESDSSNKDLPKNAQNEPSSDGPPELTNDAPISAGIENDGPKAEDNCLPPLNASLVRNTPGFNGAARANEKRMSFSTPRRRLSHIRALDFNTPPKDSDQSIRRANTSPKNMSVNALSPNTTGKSIKSSLAGSLFKAPGDGSQRTSKVKAHLFKSPDYPFSLSSGYKIPSSAVTSTPCEASCSKDGDSLQQPSSAWDKIGGVSLILDSAVSPVKRVEPQCKKGLKSWDSDLRSLISSDPEPLPKEPSSVQPAPKRKVPPPAQRRRVRGKKNQKTEETKSKEEAPDKGDEAEKITDQSVAEKKSFEKSHEISTASDCEMAKMLENNLMDASSESTKKESPPKSSVTTALISERNTEIPCEGKVIGESAANRESSCAKPALSETATEGNSHEDSSNTLTEMDQSNSGSDCNLNSVSNIGLLDSPKETIPTKAQAHEESVNNCEDTVTNKASTPVADGIIGSAVEKFRLSKATLKESFSFETPLKDNAFANMIPQTPCFLDPSSQSNEDTPRTKIIKAIPLPMMPSAETSESNTPTLPPTPTIRTTTPSVSPTIPYYQPKESPSRRTQIFKSSPKMKSFDSLNSILVQECSRLEASGMRELPKKCVIEPSQNQDQIQVLIESEDDADITKGSSEDGTSTANKEQNNDVMEVDIKLGCARLMSYKRKPRPDQMNKLIIDALSEPSRRRNCSSDENVDCMIVSPQKDALESSTKDKPPSPQKDVLESSTKAKPPSPRKDALESSTNDKSLSPQKDALESSTNDKSQPKECTCDPEILTSPRPSVSKSSESKISPECTYNDEVATSCRHSLSNATNSVLETVNSEIQEAEEILGRKVFGTKLSITPSKSLQPLQKILSSPVVSPSDKKQPGVGLAVSNVSPLRHEASSPLRKPLSTPVKMKSVEKSKPSSSKKKTPRKRNPLESDDDDDDDDLPSSKKKTPRKRNPIESDNDDDSSDSSSSSSSGSSSASDTNSSSCSSSSDESTPVKENASPEKQPTPLKSRTRRSAEKDQPKPDLAASPSALEQEAPPLKPSGAEITEICSNVSEVVGSSGQVSQEAEAAAHVNHELKSLIETKDMGTCQRIASSRNAHSAKVSDIINEMQEKRRRTLDALKKGSSGRSKNSKDKVLNPFAMHKTQESMKPEIVSRRKQVGIADKQQTKEPNSSTEAPKNQHSKSDPEKPVNERESQEGRRSLSDGTTNPQSDEDEGYKLHLDEEDDKDEPPPETSAQPIDEVEKQIAAMHESILSPDVITHEQPTVVGSQKVVDEVRKNLSDLGEKPLDAGSVEKSLEMDSQKVVSKVRKEDQLSKVSAPGTSIHEEPSERHSQKVIDGLEKVDQLSKAPPVVMSTHEKPLVIGTKKVIDEVEKEDQLPERPKASVQGGKPVLAKASSKAADEVLRTLLEKGFGCALPPPPPGKIRKVEPNVQEANSEKKGDKIASNEKKTEVGTGQSNKVKTIAENCDKKAANSEKSNKKAVSTSEKPDVKTSRPKDINSSKRSNSRVNMYPEDAEEHHSDADDEDDACMEEINTSLGNAVELKLTYKGLGHFVPKRDLCVAKPLKIMMGEGQPISLAPTLFLPLFERIPGEHSPKSESAKKQAQEPVSRKMSRTSKSNLSRRTSGGSLVRTTWDGTCSRHQNSRSGRNRSPSPRYRRVSHHNNDRGSVRDTHRSQGYYPRRDSYNRRHEANSSHHRGSSEYESRLSEASKSRTKPVERQEAEDGEILSSDSSDFEVKTNNRRRKASSPPSMRQVKRSAREGMTTTEKGSKESEPKKTHSSPLKVKRTTRRVSQSVAKFSMDLTESSEKERKTKKKGTVEKQSQKVPTTTSEKLGRDTQDEDVDDLDLDNTIFPVLGEDADDFENSTKETQPNGSNENDQSGVVTRRRAPPRSVNAHKVSAMETCTPIQKGKRKLSTSPDVASEDSCHSVLSSTNPEGQVRSSIKAATCSTAPPAKMSKPNNKGEKVAETEIIKNLDVESFLSKLHG